MIVGGRYELIEVAGRGGMADVWRGRVRGDSGFLRDVAVKQMHQNLACSRPYVAMFVEEARVGSSLQSPNIAEVHDFVHEGGNYYMVLEWIEGVDLGSWYGTESRTNRRAGSWSPRSASASCAASPPRTSASDRRPAAADRPPRRFAAQRPAHDARDGEADRFRPRARTGSRAGADRARHREGQDVVSLARDRAGRAAVPASDQFASGSVLWEALVGRKLFDGATDYETYCRLRDCMVQPLRPLRADCRAVRADHPPRAVARASTSGSRRRARWRGRSAPRSRRSSSARISTPCSRRASRDSAAMGSIRARDRHVGGDADRGDPAESTPRIEMPIPGRKRRPKAQEKPRGLRHYLPFFGRKRG